MSLEGGSATQRVFQGDYMARYQTSSSSYLDLLFVFTHILIMILITIFAKVTSSPTRVLVGGDVVATSEFSVGKDNADVVIEV